MKKAVKLFAGALSMAALAAGAYKMHHLNEETKENYEKKVNKFKSYYNVLNQWFMNKHLGKSLEKVLKEEGIKSVAIYGMGELGYRLYEDLKDTSIDVKYAIDQSSVGIGIDVFKLDEVDVNVKVDMVIVTAVFDYDAIESEIKSKLDVRVESLAVLVSKM